MSRGGGMGPVLRNPRFMVFALSQAVSLFGDKLDYMALLAMLGFFSTRLGWQASRAISFLSVVAALPPIVFGPLAGLLADRWDRRKLMIGCDTGRALLVLVIPWAAVTFTSLPLIYAISFAVFSLGFVFNTARMAVIPNLVGMGNGERHSGAEVAGGSAKSEVRSPETEVESPEFQVTSSRSSALLGANSLMSFTGRVATLLGMVVGGLIVDWTGWRRLGITHPWTAGFYIDSLTYFVSVVALVLLYRRMADVGHPKEEPQRHGGFVTVPPARPVLDRFHHLWADLVEAWRLVLRTPGVRFVFGAIVLLVVMGAAVLVLFIPLVQLDSGQGLGLGTKGVGFVAAIGSVGLALSSLGYGLLGQRVSRQTAMLGAFLVLSLVLAGMAFARTFAPVAALAFVGGLALSPVYIAMDTLVHEHVPAAARGRVFSSRDWVMHLAFAASALGIGQLTRVASLRILLLVFGAFGLLVTVAGLAFGVGRIRIPQYKGEDNA